jgi:hypothetical protein
MKAIVIVSCFVLIATTFAVSNIEKKIFHEHFDSSGDGVLDVEEISFFGCPGHDKHCASEEQLARLLKRFDADGDSTVSYDEFASNIPVSSPVGPSVQQVHLALTCDPTEMVVMWVTAEIQDSVVKYGLNSQNYVFSANGTLSTYDVGVDGWKGYVHTVMLTGLQPSTKYYYIAGSVNQNNWSQEFSFTTAPDTNTGKHVFAVMGDMGTTIPMGWAVTNQMVTDNEKYHFGAILHVGDVAYAGTGSTYELEEVWDMWCTQVQPLAANVPYMFAVGNHEHYYNYTSYRTRFTMPGDECGGNHNFWYSINYGPVHLIFMSTEHPYDSTSVQGHWLLNDLANIDHEQTPWVIAMGHRPMYCSDQDEYDAQSPGAYFQTTIEPLFEQYGVDLYLCGHMHMYERIFPVNNGTVIQTGNVWNNPGATAHVVQGTAGVFTDNSRKWVDPEPEWSAYRSDDWGYGRMTAYNHTHLHYEFLREWDNSVVDHFWLIKN